MTTDLIPPLNDKGSDIEWLRDVPSHWAVRRLRNTCMMRVSNVDKHKRDGEFPVRLCNYVDVYKNDWIRSQLDFMPATATRDEIERFRLQRGDVLITKDSETWTDIGVPALVESTRDDLVSGYHLALLRPFPKHLNSSYLFWALHSVSIQYQFHIAATGVTRYGLSHNAIKSILLPVPPLTEQIAIVRFLSYIDEQIRCYIRIKQNLIESLREYGFSIINHAVTCGLDPAVRLRRSGIKGLEDIPEHWQARRLGQIGTLYKGRGGNKDDEIPTGIPCVRYGDLYTSHRYSISKSRACIPDCKYQEYTPLQFGDVVFAGSGETIDEIGKSAVNLMKSKACCGGDVILFRSRHQVDAQFLGYATDCQSSIAQKATMGRGITVMHIYKDQLKRLALAIPPLPEQVAIASFLNRMNSNIDKAIKSVQQEISLLSEYRTRLIADVVTGKLDVREAVNYTPEESDEPNSTNGEDARRHSPADIGSGVPEIES